MRMKYALEFGEYKSGTTYLLLIMLLNLLRSDMVQTPQIYLGEDTPIANFGLAQGLTYIVFLSVWNLGTSGASCLFLPAGFYPCCREKEAEL